MTAEELAANPEPPLVGDQLTGDPAHDLAIVAPSALRLRVWGRTLMEAHRACQNPGDLVSG